MLNRLCNSDQSCVTQSFFSVFCFLSACATQTSDSSSDTFNSSSDLRADRATLIKNSHLLIYLHTGTTMSYNIWIVGGCCWIGWKKVGGSWIWL